MIISGIILALAVCQLGLTVWAGIDLHKAEKRQKDIERRFYGRSNDD